MNEAPLPHPFLQAYRGNFRSALRWEQLDALWERVRARADESWFVYAVGEPPPQQPVSREGLETFLAEVDALLHKEHDEDYCGIVYADDMERPTFVKIYDPNNLGSVCGPGSAPPPLPGWIVSQTAPIDLPGALAPPGNRRRWWQRLFGG